MFAAFSAANRRRTLIGGSLVVLVLGAAGFGWWWWKSNQSEPETVPQVKNKKRPDMVAVLKANSRGIGLMEQFHFDKAVPVFEKVVELAPDWLPGKINLGIALLNRDQAAGEGGQRARKLFRDILAKDPDNPYGHFCLGIIKAYGGKVEERSEATAHFETVTRIDPGDAAAWFWLGASLLNDSERAIKCFRRALQLDPQLGPAYYRLRGLLIVKDPRAADQALALALAFRVPGDDKDTWGNPIDYKYGRMGRYGDVIGRASEQGTRLKTGPLPRFHPSDQLKIQLANGTSWATRADLGTDEVGKLRARARDRFGAVMVVLDYNNDGKPDLFLVGAVIRDGQVRDLLLRNDGDGKFTDVTAEANLGDARPSLGCCVADYDNDGYPDLLITGAGEQHLFRNTRKGAFEDVTAKAELDQLKTICLGAAFVDLDLDGDLDLVVAQYGSIDQAETALRGKGQVSGGGLAVFLNIGEAVAGAESVSRPLTTRFRRVKDARDPHVKDPGLLLGGPVPAVNVAVSDLDDDKDVDLFVLADKRPATVVVNDRLLRFRRVTLPKKFLASGSWNGALVLDANRDDRSDLLVVGPSRSPVLLLNQPGGSPTSPRKWFRAGVIKSPPLLQAQAVDLDLDGWTDVVGLSNKHIPVLLHNQGGRLVHVPEALGSDEAWPGDLIGLAVADFAGHRRPDVMVWSEKKGLQLHVNQGNGNHGLYLRLAGQRRIQKAPLPPAGHKTRSNADGFGVKVSAHASDLWTVVENTTLSAGLGQSHQPLLLGLGRFTEAQAVRLMWTDNVLQAELNVPTGQVVRLEEIERRSDSCPLLFTWDGERYTFVTDFLGAGSMGESLAGGGHRLPRPEESLKIEAHQLRPRNGEYILKIAVPMDETTYLDRLQLVVLNHPAGVVVYPDERFTDASSPPSQQLLAFARDRRIFPRKALDHRGRDVTQTLRKWDRDTVNRFAQRAWLGLAEEHWVELDFGKQLERLGPRDRLFLCLAGWTDYPYPESFWAAEQAGVAVLPPVLERLVEDGKGRKWEPLVTAAGQPVEVGFPAGLPRMMTLEVTGLVGKHSRRPLCGPNCVLRLRTNLEVYWDQVFLAPLLQTVSTRKRQSAGEQRTACATCLEVNRAELSARGLMQEFSPDGKLPTLYDYDRVERVPVSRLSGRLTRYGPVTELLREVDDCFVIFGPGDVLTVKFDAGALPELRRGWTRSFVLRTWGYCKDWAPFTATGDTVEPLPFRKMSTYPYGPKEHYPRSARHASYRREYNTRQVGPKPVKRAR